MNMNWFFSLWFALLLLAWAPVSAKEKYVCKYKMEQGAALRYKTDTRILALQEVMGSEFESKSSFSGITKASLQGYDKNDNLEIILEIEALEITVQSMQVDSTLSNPDGLVGKQIRKLLAPNGDQLASVEIDTFLVPGFMPGFSSEQEFLPNLPGQPLETGATVQLSDIDTTHTRGGQTIRKMKVDFTLLGEELLAGHNCLKMAVKGEIELTGEGSMRGMSFFLEGDGDIEGIIHFEPTAGILVGMQNAIDIEMTIAVTGQQTMVIPTSQTIETKMELMP